MGISLDMSKENKHSKLLFLCTIIHTISLFGIFLLLLCKTHIWECLFTDVFWGAIGSLGTLISVVITCVVFIKSQSEQKKRNTYEIFGTFKNTVFDYENIIDQEYVEAALNEYRQKCPHQGDENHDYTDRGEKSSSKCECIKKYLTQVERVATCANTGILDMETIYNMGGPYMISMYDTLEPIIKEKRVSEGRLTVYSEFEKMVTALRKYGKK